MSFASLGQNFCILLYKCHWRSSGNPGGFINGGILFFDGCHVVSLLFSCFFRILTACSNKHIPKGTPGHPKTLEFTDSFNSSGVLIKNTAPFIKLDKIGAIIITN